MDRGTVRMSAEPLHAATGLSRRQEARHTAAKPPPTTFLRLKRGCSTIEAKKVLLGLLRILAVVPIFCSFGDTPSAVVISRYTTSRPALSTRR